jgi:NAD-dependent histone deacetylase SIR2
MKGRDLFDCNIWADPLKTSVFYRFATSLRQRVKEVEPTITHRFIAQMRDVGKLARVYTQNIDEIEKKIGLSTDLKHGFGNKKRKSIKQQPPESERERVTEIVAEKGSPGAKGIIHASQTSEDSIQPKPRLNFSPDKGVECVFLHGSLHALRCFVCGKLCDWDEGGRESRTLSGEQPECPHCAGATAARQEKGKRALGIGKLRPDIVLYGEEHPQSDLISPIVQHDLAAGPDLLLVLGTSLRVHGLKVMVKEFAKAVHKKGGKVVFINFTKPSESAWGDVLDYWIEWDCDAWVEDLKTRKPRLWLSPDERMELDRQRRETLAEKRRETLKKRESINEKKRDSPGDKGQHAPEQNKARPPPKNPVAMRNDYQCGAYIVWDIFQTLARIGERPFDNLGYTPPTSDLATAAVQGMTPSTKDRRCEPGIAPQTTQKALKGNRKPLPARAPRQAKSSLGQPTLNEPHPLPDEPSNSSRLSTSAVPGPSLGAPKPTQQNITSMPTSKPATKVKKPRKSAPATLISSVDSTRKRKSMNNNKGQERHTGKDRYLKAVKELVRSRKTPVSGNLAILDPLPATPGYKSLIPGAESHHPYPRAAPRCGYLDGQAIVDEGGRRHSASYLFQLQRILPLPDPPVAAHNSSTHRPLPASGAGTEFAPEGPMLAPINVNWRQSPPSKIPPMEIAPFVGPASPLADKRSGSSKPQYSYTMHHSTQPIYTDPLKGISRQGVAHKAQWHADTNEDNTPSPSDQLHMEAANQLWQMRGKI